MRRFHQKKSGGVRLEIHFTPKHGSWLDIAEIEISVLKRQCLANRIDCIEKMRATVRHGISIETIVKPRSIGSLPLAMPVPS
jgi:hypothetical protein